MWDHLLISLFILYYIAFAGCGYPPMGDEVQAGSVLLPASRRGRYLANIVRRQAVDGTGIKFNKDADRMNAEAKKKVDVLSEELLPYIIAEQERRITLYRRVMTAIQNGEKGVTIAEIRNKPPAIVRKGLMYRCPTNRAPREPDGSGVILCEDNLKPTPILFESCLSAEDKELFVAENKYFFCNRHKVEGPDLPRNGTMVIGCAPCERTPLNYTSQKCALEDTDDVVVHYRYYPDRTYKFVSELDPDREVCDHWNPCQIGYIFSLPGPDQATPASELWHTDEEISREEIIPAALEDSNVETVPLEFVGQHYTTSMRIKEIPNDYQFTGIGRMYTNGTTHRILGIQNNTSNVENLSIDYQKLDKSVKITIKFHPLLEADYALYYMYLNSFNRDPPRVIHLKFLNIKPGLTKLKKVVQVAWPGQQLNLTSVAYECEQCVLDGIILRAADGSTHSLERDKYHLRNTHMQKEIKFEFSTVTGRDFGDYFLIMQGDDGTEERIKAISIKDPTSLISLVPLHTTATVGEPVQINSMFKCDKDCVLKDILCAGNSVLNTPGVGYNAITKRISIDIPSFDNKNACAYIATFLIDDVLYRKNVAIFEKVELLSTEPLRVPPPAEGAFFERTTKYKCSRPDCTLINVTLNGFPLQTTTRRSSVGSVAYFLPGDSSVTIGITEYSSLYEGVYQAVFALGSDPVTKTLMEIGPEEPQEATIETHENQNNAAEETEGESAVDSDTDAKSDVDAGTDTKSGSDSDTDVKPDADAGTDTTTEADAGTDAKNETDSAASGRRQHLSPPGTRRNAADADKSMGVLPVREAVAAGGAYQRELHYAAPAGELAAVSCRGRNISAGWHRAANDTLLIDFDHFEDSNACVYKGIFKIGKTEHIKTLAVLEMIKVSALAVVPPPAAGALHHTVVYTCNVTKCDPQKIYINDRTLKSDDKEHFYSYKSEMVKAQDGEVMTVTINFSIAPFTKEFEGVYQVVVSTGTETVTKNIMEVGSVV